MKNKVSRYGAYGLLHKDNHMLLTLKKSGPYKGRWDLPGGGIEFGEAPEEALKREFLEEAALAIDHVELLCIATANGTYENNGEPYHFHHVGILYRVGDSSPVSHLSPEEEGHWVSITNANPAQLTPFAKHVLENFNRFI